MIAGIRFRETTTADVPAMELCRLADPIDGPADPRMAAYFDRQHHPQQALLPRVGYVALANDTVIGYIAGHRTTRHGCSGEVQYVFVAPAYRRRGIGTALLQLLAEWFQAQAAQKVRVAVLTVLQRPSLSMRGVGASRLKRNWCAWEDIGTLVRSNVPN